MLCSNFIECSIVLSGVGIDLVRQGVGIQILLEL